MSEVRKLAILSRPTLDLGVYLHLTESQARALYMIGSFGGGSVAKVVHKNLGGSEIPAKDIEELFNHVKVVLAPIVDKFDAAKKFWEKL